MGLFGFGKRKKQIIAYLEQADSAVFGKRYDDALGIYQELLKMEYWDAYGLMGDVYRELGDTDKMIELYQKGTRAASPSSAAYRGLARCLIYGMYYEQDLRKAKEYMSKADDAIDYLIGDAAQNDALRKSATLEREYEEEYKLYQAWKDEQKRLADEATGHGVVRRAVDNAPKELIKGLHPYRRALYAMNANSFMSSVHFKIASQDVALAINTALLENHGFEAGFVFTTYGVASHYFIAPRNMIGKSNFWEECSVTVPYYGLTEVEQEDKYVHCRYNNRDEIIVLAGDHAAWLCRVLYNLIAEGYTMLPHISPFIKVTGKP